MTTQILKNQLYRRWDLLPEILREATTSETNSAIVWKTGEAEHLPKEKLSVVSRLTGYVLMGFIHPEDLAREIQENLGIDIRIATSIADPINKKVFQPLRGELEKIYSPATEGNERAGGSQPVLMDSVISSRTEDAVKLVPVSSAPKFFQTGQIPKPSIPSPIPAPKPITQPTIAVPVVTTVSPAPFILHMESKAQPIAPSKAGFKVGLSEEQFGKMEQKWTAPPRPAQIEAGTSNTSPLDQFAKLAGGASSNPVLNRQNVSGQASSFNDAPLNQIQDKSPRVVHYNDKEILPPQIIQPPAIKTVPLPPMPPAPPLLRSESRPLGGSKTEVPIPKPLIQNKIGVPVPPSVEQKKVSIAVPTPPKKSTETEKQKVMLPGKPQELDLPAPQI